MRYASLRWLLALLILVVGAAACDPRGEGPERLPTGPQALLGGLLGGGSGGGSGQSYTFANDHIVPDLVGEPLSVTGIVGFGGGTLEVLGHRLDVPRGAVLQPTLFTLTVLPTGYVEVYLGASITDLLGRVLNVGSSGFRRPVTVTLTYARSTNVPDPAALVVLRVKGANSYEALPSRVDRRTRTVSAELDHFSRYMLAYPN